MSLTFTHEELSKYDGTDASLPIYVAIKGSVFDVSTKKESYGPGAGYHCFAGKDASKVISQGSSGQL
jgi:predicted heme/steroid binding protein